MPTQATSTDSEPWRTREAAWAEVRRLVNGDPMAVHLLERFEPVWSKEGSEAFMQLLRDMQRVQELVEELGPTVSRLKRGAAAFSKATETVAEKMSPQAAKQATQLEETLEGFLGGFVVLQRHTERAAEWYLPTVGGIREQPTNLVEALERAAGTFPALRPVLSKRGLALYEIATARAEPCSSEHEFTDTREERWKKNLARARPGT